MSEKKILILNLTRMGDIIQSSPLIKGLKNKYKNSIITYGLLENFKDTAQLIPEIDEVISLDFSNVLRFIDNFNLNEAFNICRELVFKKFSSYDILINLTFSKLSGYLAFFIKAREKRGLIYTDHNEFQVEDEWSRFFLSIVDYREYCPFNLVDIYSKIGNVNTLFDIQYPEIISKNFAFVMGASTYDRRWSSENFAQLAKLILTTYPDAKIYLFGTKSEKSLSEKFFNIFQHKNILDFIGKTDIVSLYNIILSNVDIVITNDTGTMHIGWLAGKKIIELSLGPALYNTTGPYGAGHIVLQPDVDCAPCSYNTKCINLDCHRCITPEIVFEVIKYILENREIMIKGNVKILKSYFNNENFIDYKLIYGKESNDILERKLLREIWLNTLENCLKNFKKYNIRDNNYILSLFSQLKSINILIDKSLELIDIKDTLNIKNNIELILAQENEVKKIIFAEFRELIPFYKFAEYKRNTLSFDNLKSNLITLKEIYLILKLQIMHLYKNYKKGV